MKVLFVIKESLMMERLGIMYLSAMLKSHGHDVRLAIANRLGFDGLKELVGDYAPSVIGYSIMTGEYAKILHYNRYLKKEFTFLSVFGGPHPTFFPDIISEESVDAVCIGEGDAVFAALCDRMDKNGDYWNTPNFWIKHGKKIVRNPVSPLIENLDSLLFPDRSIMYDVDPALRQEGFKVFYASRGCPYQCSYCYNDSYNKIYSGQKRIVRYRSAENIIDEIDAVRRQYPLSSVRIDDDNFLLKPQEWFQAFAKAYKEKIALPFSVNVKPNLVREGVMSLLKEAGLDSVWIGVECGNQEIANTLLRRNLTNERIVNAVRIMQSFDIKVCTHSLIGLPVVDAYKVDLQTLDFNIALQPTFARSAILHPYPGTAIQFHAQKNGFLGKEVSFLETNTKSTLFNFTKEEKRKIENIHKLFGLMVRFPFLRKYADFLCSLPLKFFYTFLFYVWFGYNAKFKLFAMRSLKKELGSYLRLFWKLIRSS